MEEERLDQIRRLTEHRNNLGPGDQEQSIGENLDFEKLARNLVQTEISIGDSRASQNCLFSVLKRIKIKLEATKSFPLDLRSTLLITEDDMKEYQDILKQQNEKQKN